MENLNRVEIRGAVGSAHHFQNEFGKFVRLSVCTQFVYRNREGNAEIETTWHSVIVHVGKNVELPEGLDKGSVVQITGRIRQQRYVDCNGEERSTYEIVAHECSVISQK